MLIIGEKEVEAVRAVIQEGEPFRYHQSSHCARFEERFAGLLGVGNVVQTSSGTAALTAALIGLGIGPGDEVLVPAHTFMATAVAVVTVGAIPVIVDIDESVAIDPDAIDKAVGPRTKAVIPVHMWGTSCDMDRVMEVAGKHGLLVAEDACQAIGGAYKGKILGSFGKAAAFSFNYYKILTCGEGGAVATGDEATLKRVQCAVDCARFYWTGRDKDFQGFAFNSSRPSEFEGAILNAQLDRLDGMLTAMRAQKKRIMAETSDVVKSVPCHSPDGECGLTNLFQFETPEQADRFAQETDGTVLSKTGRHVYTEWDPVLSHQGSHHPALNPFLIPANAECRKDYTHDMCSRTLDILARTVKIGNHPEKSEKEVDQLIEKIRSAGRSSS